MKRIYRKQCIDHFSRFLLILSLVSVLFGCIPATTNPTPNSSQSSETVPAVSPSTTLMATTIVVKTDTPPTKLLQTPSSIPTSPMYTPTLHATLSKVQVEASVWEILRNNGGCSFPCFGDIVPGKTSLDVAANLVARFGLSLKKTYQEEQKEFYEFGYRLEKHLRLSVVLTVQNQLVQNIDSVVDFLPSEGSSVASLGLYISPDTLIQNYGTPSKVDLFLSFPAEAGFPEGTAWYGLVFYYKQYDLIIQYWHATTKSGDFIPACPLSDHFDSVRFWAGNDPENPPIEGVSFEEATSLSLDMFSQIMNLNPESACYSLKRAVFYP